MFRDYLIQTLVLSNLLTQFQLHVQMAPQGHHTVSWCADLMRAHASVTSRKSGSDLGEDNWYHSVAGPSGHSSSWSPRWPCRSLSWGDHCQQRELLGAPWAPVKDWCHHAEPSVDSTQKCQVYTSKTIQENIIDISGKMIREKLTEPLRTGGVPFYAVIADEVTDRHANQEVLSVCIRYVDVTGGGSAEIVEKLIDFVELTRTTGEAVRNGILASLRTANLDLKMIRGQAYDGASSMSSAHVGAQAVVKEASNQNATYVHCHSRRLNLSIASSCKLPEIRNIIGIVNEIFLFFDFSRKRQKFLEVVLAEYAPDTRHEKLKGLCKTRWVERHTCLETFLELYEFIVVCLCAMCTPDDYTAVQQQVWDWERETQTRAQDMVTSLQKFINIVAFIILKSALDYIKGLAA